MQSYWFGDVGDGCCTLFIGDLNAIIDRDSIDFLKYGLLYTARMGAGSSLRCMS